MNAEQMEAQYRYSTRNEVEEHLESIIRMCDHGYDASEDSQFAVIKGAAQLALKRLEDVL